MQELRPQEDFLSSDDFICDGMLDSFDLLSLIREMEIVFSIFIDGTEIIPENVKNLPSIRSLLEKHQVPNLREPIETRNEPKV